MASADRRKISETAQNFAARNQFEQAIAEYQKILATDPADVRTLLKIGDLQIRMNAPAQAVETYQHVGSLYEHQGLHQKAIAVYKQILQINPDQLALYNRVAATTSAATPSTRPSAAAAPTTCMAPAKRERWPSLRFGSSVRAELVEAPSRTSTALRQAQGERFFPH